MAGPYYQLLEVVPRKARREKKKKKEVIALFNLFISLFIAPFLIARVYIWMSLLDLKRENCKF
jgi:hypothetical protein